MGLEEDIDARVGEVRTDTFDMSFGEIVNLHGSHELIIQPEYQRLFRWTDVQKSHLIESILLELPIPQIFVIENDDGVLELIDGLQRVSSVLQFIEPETLDLEPLTLESCGLVPSLNGLRFEDLPLSLRLRIKRSPVRVVVIKRQSRSFLRYEMFKRLNTGGANLSPQEIRNCSSRMFGEPGITFYSFIVELASDENFKACAEYLADATMERKGDEELVLRFSALKNHLDGYKGNVREWLDDFMERVLSGGEVFDFDAERSSFRKVFKLAHEKLGDTAFVRYRGGNPTGGLAPAYFEAIAIGLQRNVDTLSVKSPEAVRQSVTNTIQSQEFGTVTGPGANSTWKLHKRIELVANALAEL